MKILLLLTLIFSGNCFAQIKSNSLNLGVCDSIPNNLYKKKLRTLTVTNDQGYCKSPVKILSSEIRQMELLETLVYYSSDTSAKLPSEIKYLKNLKHLNTSDIISDISELTELRTLSINASSTQEINDLKSLSFEKLIKLEQLSIGFNGNLDSDYYTDLFKGFKALVNLKHLSLYQVNETILSQIPPLNHLESLNINGVIGELSLDFNEFSNLTKVAIKRAPNVSEIPLSIYQLKQLQELSFTNSGIESVPKGISNLKQLKVLNLGHNKIVSLAADICKLNQLEILVLSRNFNLKTLPESIGNLSHLKRLAVESCQLNKLPESISELNQLEILTFNTNKIKQLPNDWSNLSRLKRLNAERNMIEIIPASLLEIESLEYLHLGFNNLLASTFTNNTLPIGKLNSLKQLDLQYNDLTELPCDIGKLSSLKDLNIYNNQIHTLPHSIGHLKKLNSLSMSHNKIEFLPKEIRSLRIYEFSLHNNAFRSVEAFSTNFPNVDRTWVDKKFKEALSSTSSIANEVYFR